MTDDNDAKQPRFDSNSTALLTMGGVVFAVGMVLGLGIVFFAGGVMMVAGLLPPTKDKHD